jgi:hypothetical protein
VAWQNDDLNLFHGCSDASLHPQNLDGIRVGRRRHAIDHSVGARRPDFGPGFYATTWLQQAKNWANIRVNKLRRRHPNAIGIVLRFTLKRNDLARLEDLVFISDEGGYFPFVGYCRSGGDPHAPIATRSKLYDIIYGPVSLAGQTLTINRSNQVSFHTKRATNKIWVFVESSG